MMVIKYKKQQTNFTHLPFTKTHYRSSSYREAMDIPKVVGILHKKL